MKTLFKDTRNKPCGFVLEFKMSVLKIVKSTNMLTITRSKVHLTFPIVSQKCQIISA